MEDIYSLWLGAFVRVSVYAGMQWLDLLAKLNAPRKAYLTEADFDWL